MFAPLTNSNLPPKILCFGRSGAGKTIFSCSSQTLRTALIDVDISSSSAYSWEGLPSQGYPATNKNLVSVKQVKNFAEFELAFQYIEKNVSQFQLLSIDTGSEMMRKLLQEIYRGQGRTSPQQGDWGMLLSFAEQVFDRIRNLPIPVIVTSHENLRFDQEVGRNRYQPFFQGQFGELGYGKYFDLVCRLFVYDVPHIDPVTGQQAFAPTRVLQCQSDQMTYAKDRNTVFDMYEIPLIDNLFWKIEQKKLRLGTTYATTSA